MTSYWKDGDLGQTRIEKRKAESEDEVPKKKPKKQHKRFTSPVTLEIDEGVQRYMEALAREGKAMSTLVRPPSTQLGSSDEEPISSPMPPKSPRPQPRALEITATAAAAHASTSGMLASHTGAATPPHQSSSTSPPHEKPLMSPPSLLNYQSPPRLPSNPYESKIIAWKISHNFRSLSYQVVITGSATPPL